MTKRVLGEIAAAALGLVAFLAVIEVLNVAIPAIKASLGLP